MGGQGDHVLDLADAAVDAVQVGDRGDLAAGEAGEGPLGDDLAQAGVDLEHALDGDRVAPRPVPPAPPDAAGGGGLPAPPPCPGPAPRRGAGGGGGSWAPRGGTWARGPPTPRPGWRPPPASASPPV